MENNEEEKSYIPNQIVSKENLKTYFDNGDIPKEEEFWQWQDSYWHKNDPQDVIPAGRVDLSGKADKNATNLDGENVQNWRTKLNIENTDQNNIPIVHTFTLEDIGATGDEDEETLNQLIADYINAQNIVIGEKELHYFQLVGLPDSDGETEKITIPDWEMKSYKQGDLVSHNVPLLRGNNVLEQAEQSILQRGLSIEESSTNSHSIGIWRSEEDSNIAEPGVSEWKKIISLDEWGVELLSYESGNVYNQGQLIYVPYSLIGGNVGYFIITPTNSNSIIDNSVITRVQNYVVNGMPDEIDENLIGKTVIGNVLNLLDGREFSIFIEDSVLQLLGQPQNLAIYLQDYNGTQSQSTVEFVLGEQTFPISNMNISEIETSIHPYMTFYNNTFWRESKLFELDENGNAIGYLQLKQPKENLSWKLLADTNKYESNLLSQGDFIPLTGTEESNPVTGPIVIQSQILDNIKRSVSPDSPISLVNPTTPILTGYDNDTDILYQQGGVGMAMSKDNSRIVFSTNSVQLGTEDACFIVDTKKTGVGNNVGKGIQGFDYYGDNYDDNTYTQKKYVDRANSYSTEEIKTGGTWIDGKPIYRKVFDINIPLGTDIGTDSSQNYLFMLSGLNIENIIKENIMIRSSDGLLIFSFKDFSIWLKQQHDVDFTTVSYRRVNVFNNIITPMNPVTEFLTPYEFIIEGVLEYTKTTD